MAQLCLFKLNYKIGEEIIGVFDFLPGQSRCLQYSVTLKCEEIVYPDSSEDSKSKILVFNNFHEMCVGFEKSNLVLQIPLNATPSFKSDLCQLKYFLHFQFVLNSKGKFVMSVPEGGEWNGPSGVNVETLVWDLPINVFPTDPQFVACALKMPTVNSVVL